jgi:hypothetical protein
MTDFVYPGKYCGLYPEFKRELFLEVSNIINECKFYSVAVHVSRDDFDAELSQEVKRNLLGPYAFVFFCTVISTLSAIEESQLFEGRISYLIDIGSAHPEQLLAAHSLIVKTQKGSVGGARIGAFGQDSDDNVPALQAADVISWSARKKLLDGVLPDGLEPINCILERLHVSPVIPRQGIAMIAAPINNWIAKHGTIPRLSDIVMK